jgi:GTP-binding protein YchF
VVGASPVVHETIEFHDIAGLVRGAHTGEGLGNRFLGHIRETDAIVHVVRAHDEPNVPHPEGRVDPTADVETVETELLYADLEQAERRLERVARDAKSGEREAVEEEARLRELVAALGEGRPARELGGGFGELQPLTAKPVLYVANVAEGSAEISAGLPEGTLALSARVEAELAELPADEAAAMRMELGVPEGGLELLVREAFELLGLLSFFTAHEDVEARARVVPRGTTAWEGAGVVHTDMQRGFARAEVVPWDVLVDAGGYAAARERGVLRLEGRDYVLSDGDVVTFRSSS